MDIISERLRILRKEKGLKQSDIAGNVCLGRGTYASYENGTTPSVETLVTLAKFYDVSLDYLTGLSNKRQSENGTVEQSLGKLSAYIGSSAPQSSELSALMEAAVRYYIAGMPCGLEPIHAWRQFTADVTVCLNAATIRDTAALLDQSNRAVIHALDISKMPARMLEPKI